MAFRNASLAATTSLSTLYACPAGYEAVVHALYIANVSSLQSSITVDVLVTTNNPTTRTVHILKGTVILYGTTLVFDKPINLRPGDSIEVLSNTAGAAEVNASILLDAADTVAP